MDIGARCSQCHGRGFIGGGRAFAYPYRPTARQQCDRCHGTGHNAAHSPIMPSDPLDMPVPGIPGLRFRDLEQHSADLRAADDDLAEHVARYGRFRQGVDDYLPN